MNNELIPHLFRTEFSKITAVLCKLFGIEHIEIAEDIASETFLAALETWSYKGIPKTQLPGFIQLQKTKQKIIFSRNAIFQRKNCTANKTYIIIFNEEMKLICLKKILPTASCKCCLQFVILPFQQKHK